MKIDWDALTEEGVKYLREYIRIDTTNPPGNEGPAARLLKGIIEAEGLNVLTCAARPERPNIMSRIRGRNTEKAFILLHHMDVVGAERENWTVDPFGGEIREGYIWGRGALDMKGMGIAELMAFLLIKRLSIPLRRDLIYLATVDEEAGSNEGAEWMVNNYKGLLHADYLLNEGGYGWKKGELSGFHVCVGEKGPLWIRLSAEGMPGHGSIPHRENSCAHLVKALWLLSQYRRPPRVVPEMEPFLRWAGIEGQCSQEVLESHPIMDEPSISAMFRDTISITILKAGGKENVIPSRAEATIDCRLLPGTDRWEFMKELSMIMEDPRVKMDVVMWQDPSSSPLDNPMYRAIVDVLGHVYPGVDAVPVISPGFTDSRCFRRLGVNCYGLLPFLIERDDLRSMHGKDERLSIENLKKGTMAIFELIERLCC